MNPSQSECGFMESDKSENLLPFEKIQRKILVKREVETSPKFGKKPEERTVEELLDYGVINIDKPKGPTSHQVVYYLKEILKLEKAGHSGTLDPGVTGVLPISLGKSTKVMQYLLTAGKEYVAVMHLHKEVHPDRIHDARKSFLGTIKQLPPVRSAIVRRWRERKIYYFDIMEIDGKDVLFRTGTEAGTYIRKLIHDFGKFLDAGAHMSELRRTKAGPFNEKTLATLQDVSDAFWLYKEKKDYSEIKKIIMPIENAIKHLPKIYVADTSVDTLCHGANLNIPGVAKLDSGIEPDQAIAIMTLKGELIATGRAKLTSNKILEMEKGVAAITEKVLMEPGVYPKIQKK
jgi:H/ACA ribonucleoprotein complex subunit 4